MKNKIIIIISAVLCLWHNTAAQEWETIEKYSYYNDESIFCYEECLELTNGNILVGANFYYRSGAGDFYSEQPAVALLSSEGEELARNNYFRPGLCTTSFSPFLFEKDGEMYILTTYSPDHDSTYFNYFGNYDNPPTDAILALYKLDENLNVAESYEHIYPIDVYEDRDKLEWQINPNYYSGNIFLFSAFEDEGNITGAYFKSVSDSDEPRGQDSLFFFKMDFEGNFVLKKGYEMHISGGSEQAAYLRQQIVKTDDGYIMYTRGFTAGYDGDIEYYDNEFNHVDTKHINQPDVNAPYGHGAQTRIERISIIRSNQNTTYASVSYQGRCHGAVSDGEVRLYEIDDNISNTEILLPILHYVKRYTMNWDWAARVGVDMTNDGRIYFAYTLGTDGDNLDSYMMIEMLDPNFDTISTFYYDTKQVHEKAHSIKATEDDGILLVSSSETLADPDIQWTTISKFPASAFVNIEEAHAHNLHLAVAYPNPGGDVLNIRTGLRNATLSVYDMQGRIIHQQIITDEVTSIDASKWSSGTYVWKLGTGNGNRILESGKWEKD